MPTAQSGDLTPQTNDANQQAATDSGLVYVSDLEPGIRRRRAGKGFSYLDASGKTVRDAETLARIRALAIPPDYNDVWICRRADGHLQATGRDARGRKQYRYHRRWQELRGDGKFDRVVEFGEALPRLRRNLRRDLALAGFPRPKVLAIVVAVMADTLVRVGNREYARSNRSYGLTTLRNRHVAFLSGGRARFQFRGKGGLDHDVVLDDVRLTKLIRHCQQLPGQALFQYRDDEGGVQPVDSGQVNDYLREVMGEAFTAKDFRTWGGTLVAFQLFGATPLPVDEDSAKPPSERALAALQNQVIKEVAHTLGNTPAVCRKAYIAPAIFEGWRDGRVQDAAAAVRGERQREQALLKFLKRARREAARAARPPRAKRAAR